MENYRKISEINELFEEHNRLLNEARKIADQLEKELATIGFSRSLVQAMLDDSTRMRIGITDRLLIINRDEIEA